MKKPKKYRSRVTSVYANNWDSISLAVDKLIIEDVLDVIDIKYDFIDKRTSRAYIHYIEEITDKIEQEMKENIKKRDIKEEESKAMRDSYYKEKRKKDMSKMYYDLDNMTNIKSWDKARD